MVGSSDVKVATVDVESGDNMATLPVSRAHGGGNGNGANNGGGAGGGGTNGGGNGSDNADKVAALKEMELKNVMPKPLERFISYLNTTHSDI